MFYEIVSEENTPLKMSDKGSENLNILWKWN